MSVDRRPRIMGILNVTPDSFADGGLRLEPGAALAHAGRMLAEGADLIDVGGESTRPGARPVPAGEQLARVEPVIREIRAAHPGTRISIDTTRAEVAARALSAGAGLINDVSAGLDDPEMFRVAAAGGAELVLMHGHRGQSLEPGMDPNDTAGQVLAFLASRCAVARAAGVPRERIILDPGIGFGKSREQNLRLLRDLDRLVATGYRVLLGTSRKRFMGRICAGAEPGDLLPATCACTALGVMAGVALFRVHDVAANRQVADVAAAIRDSGPG